VFPHACKLGFEGVVSKRLVRHGTAVVIIWQAMIRIKDARTFMA
jgi:hypothetical protein